MGPGQVSLCRDRLAWSKIPVRALPQLACIEGGVCVHRANGLTWELKLGNLLQGLEKDQEIRAGDLVLTLHLGSQSCLGKPLRQQVALPCPQRKSLCPLPGQEAEVARSGLAAGSGAEQGKLPGLLLSGGNKVHSLDPPHGKSTGVVGGDSLSKRREVALQDEAQPKGHRGKGLCESTSPIPCLPNSAEE